MSTFIVLFLLASVFLIGVVDGNCCLPKQWEGNMGSIQGQNVGNSTGLVQAGSRMAFDAVNKRIASISSVVNGKLEEHVQTLQDYQKHVSYIVYNGHCQKIDLPEDFPSLCLPDTAKKNYETYFGTGDDTLNVVMYQVQEKDTTLTATFTKNCIPVSYTSYGQKGNEKFLNVEGFTGIELGIKDPSVFDIPAACKKQSFVKENAQFASQIMRRKNFPGF